MKSLFCLFATIALAVTPLSAITFTYSGTIQTVADGSTWSLSGLEVGAPFQANLQIDEALLGEDLYPYFLASGIYPLGLEFSVAGHVIDLFPLYVVSASVNSPRNFGVGGEGLGAGAFWGMWGQGTVEGGIFGAASLSGGPGFTASAQFVSSSAAVPDTGSSGVLLSISAAAMAIFAIGRRTES